jgi:hypothetical protein
VLLHSPTSSRQSEVCVNAPLLILPEIDEDGRSSWWKEHATPHARIIPLEGVGTRIDWAWDKIIELVKERFPVDGR